MTIIDFLKHMDKSVMDLINEMDKTGHYDEKYNLKIELNGKTLELDLHADLYQRMETLLIEEEEENQM